MFKFVRIKKINQKLSYLTWNKRYIKIPKPFLVVVYHKKKNKKFINNNNDGRENERTLCIENILIKNFYKQFYIN